MCNIFFPVALRIPFSSSLTLPTLTATLEFYVCFFEDSFLNYSRILAFLGSPSLIFLLFYITLSPWFICSLSLISIIIQRQMNSLHSICHLILTELQNRHSSSLDVSSEVLRHYTLHKSTSDLVFCPKLVIFLIFCVSLLLMCFKTNFPTN